jgi:hypothetical protein
MRTRKFEDLIAHLPVGSETRVKEVKDLAFAIVSLRYQDQLFLDDEHTYAVVFASMFWALFLPFYMLVSYMLFVFMFFRFFVFYEETRRLFTFYFPFSVDIPYSTLSFKEHLYFFIISFLFLCSRIRFLCSRIRYCYSIQWNPRRSNVYANWEGVDRFRAHVPLPFSVYLLCWGRNTAKDRLASESFESCCC